MKYRITNSWRVLLSMTLCVLGFTGCQETMLPEGAAPLTLEKSEAADELNDLTRGYNVMIWDVNELSGKRIELNTTEPIEISENEGGLRWHQVWEHGRSFLVPEFEGTLTAGAPATIDTRLCVSGNPEAGKTLRVVLRDKAASAARSASSDALKERAAELFGYGMHVWGDIGDHGEGSILSTEAIKPLINATTLNGMTTIDFETSGSSLKETLTELSVSVSGNMSVPIRKGKWCMSGSMAVTGSESKYHKSYYEYYLGFSGSNMGEAWINTNAMLEDGYQAYIDSVVNDVLNNPGSPAYKRYANDSLGIISLLDYYGTDVLTQGQFGGYSLGLYCRAENVHSVTITQQLDMSLGAKQSVTPGGKHSVDKILAYLRTKNGMSSGGSGGFSQSYGSTETDEATKAFSMGYIRGGNGETDQDAWRVTDNPANWILISYTRGTNSARTTIPIEDFIFDKEGERYKKVTEILGNDTSSIYFESKNRIVEGTSPLILADFMMCVGDNGHKKDDPQPKIMKGPDGVKRIYFPMMASIHYPVASERGYAAETSQGKFVRGTDKVDHYWYYALDHADECYGITFLNISNNTNNPGRVRRGDHANSGISGSLDNNYVWLECGGASTPDSKKITGIALVNLNSTEISNDDEVIACTGGTEMDNMWTSDGKDNFNIYWNDTAKYIRIKDYFYEGGLVTPVNLAFGYTTKPIQRRYVKGLSKVGADADKICHPRVWGE